MKKTLLSLVFTVLALAGFQRSAVAQTAAASPAAALPLTPVDDTGWVTPHPPYPEAARKAKLQGAVRVRVFTDRHGNIKAAKVVQSSGHPELDDATVKFALANWHGPAISRAVYVQNFYLRR